ncbi:MAG: PQQ-binding-like beta-propeller repeat protein, partial [Planctomycetota bacterium]|nr:PQQ-binding-like beta-propeller repeat protein [Planctomycetota bacterium]
MFGCSTEPAEPESAAEGPAEAASWPMFRRTQDLAGVAPGRLPAKLALRWKFQTGRAVKSSPAIELAGDDPSGASGRVFVGSNDGSIYALDLA